MGTKHDDPCIQKAADDEPLFVLRAKDASAPAVVELWASIAELHGCHPEKLAGARQTAKDMRAYATENYGGGKLPD